uniref:Uncharacterized protein n=1 Tax=Utricularia reniformis TaxID=192314 RepID=A0A1Y0B4N7_9LAMI|nr:hypothetical protein AEK19_MT2237 [Utricularia reniformis]ART32382.1 hypothetical protein AEK19_MT2237 [Utricularia reniformis]
MSSSLFLLPSAISAPRSTKLLTSLVAISIFCPCGVAWDSFAVIYPKAEDQRMRPTNAAFIEERIRPLPMNLLTYLRVYA